MDQQAILQKLPQIRTWIERTLAAHRTETRTAASYHFPRLPLFYPAIFLETAFVVVVSRVPTPPLASFGLPEFAEFEQRDFSGITYRNTYFVKESNWQDESLHFHELIHVLQWQQLGMDGFLAAYAKGLMEKGYRENPLETMAYDLQAHFDQGGEPVDVRTLVRSKLKALFPQ